MECEFQSRISIQEPIVLEESHRSRLTVHLGGMKVYKNLKRNFWWSRMKMEVIDFVSKYLIYQQVKAKHYNPGGLLHPLPVLEWK